MDSPPKVGYVLKVYPRLSQTFVLSEILEHERAGAPVEIFSLRLPNDGRFHAAVARVESPVHYLHSDDHSAGAFWRLVREASAELPGLWATLERASAVPAGDIAHAIGVALRARRIGVEHLHAHFANVATTVARLAASMAGIGYSFTAHARDIYRDSVSDDQLRLKLAGASAVVTVSRYNVEHLKDRFPAETQRIELVHNGLDLAAFPFSEPREREPLILGVGRLIEKKGFSDLIDACAELQRSGVRFRCEIVGGGPFEAALRDRVERSGLASAVELLGPRPAEDVIRRVRRASVLAAPCVVAGDGDRDGLPTVLLEAMALGTPCVATDVTGIPEIVRDGETGLAVPQHAPGELARACARLLADEALRRRLAAAARELVEARFDVERNAARLRAIFARCVGSSSVAPATR